MREIPGERKSATVIDAVAERELRGQNLDDYLADYERRKGPLPQQEQDRACRILDEVYADSGCMFQGHAPEMRVSYHPG